MQGQRLPLWALCAGACGVALWIGIVTRYPPAREAPALLESPAPPPRILFLALAVVFALVAWRNTSQGTYRLSGVAPWLAAVASWLAAWHPGRANPRPESDDRDRISRPARIALSPAILAIGSLFLFYRHAEPTRHPYSDHPENPQDLFDLPLRYLTLKIGTALIALLALPALCLLGREMGGTWLGLTVAGLAAWSKWPVSLARNGLRYTLAVLPTAVVLWALLRHFRRGDRASTLWAGVAIGLGLHGYSTFRVVPLLALPVFGLLLIDRRRRGRKREVLRDGVALAGTAFVVALPLLHYMVQHADEFWYRAATRVASVEQAVGPNPLAVFAGNVGNMLLAFNWRGSSTWALIRMYEPFLDAVTGGLFVAGVALLVALVARGSRRWAIVLAAFFIL